MASQGRFDEHGVERVKNFARASFFLHVSLPTYQSNVNENGLANAFHGAIRELSAKKVIKAKLKKWITSNSYMFLHAAKLQIKILKRWLSSKKLIEIPIEVTTN